MNETDQLRQVLYQQAINGVTANGNFPCRIGEEPFVPPDDGTIYGEFWFRTGKTEQIELGPRTGYECTVGIAQFTLYGPEKFGEGPILRLGDSLKKVFNRKQFQVPPNGYVNMETFAVQLIPGVKNGNKVVVIDGAFDFYHYDPDATP